MSKLYEMQEFFVFRLRWDELSGLSKEQQAIFAMVSFSVNEVNVFRRLCLFALYSVDDNSRVEQSAMIQRNALLRVLISKLYEFLKFFASAKKSSELDDKISDIIKNFEAEVEGLRSEKSYMVARQIRNYDIEEVQKTVESFAGDVDCNLYLTEQNGNSFYPIGEAIVFTNNLSGGSERKSHSIKTIENLDLLIDWTTRVSDCMNRFHVALFERLVDTILPDRQARRSVEWLPPDLVGAIEHHRLPLFVREAK